MSKTIIYIEEANSMADVTFPSIPRVVSLYHYDDVRRSGDSLPVAGYPAVCVTVRLKLLLNQTASKYLSPLLIVVSEFVSVFLSYANVFFFLSGLQS